MSKRHNNGSHFENHERAAEMHDGAAHAHLVAEQNHTEHLTAHEHSRQALEHSHAAHEQTQATVGRGVTAFGHSEVAARAYAIWESRGGASGSPDVDWHQATEELRTLAHSGWRLL